jgi:glycosyltransferase A (GT-A) superfamily protein (DUF2064 family)
MMGLPMGVAVFACIPEAKGKTRLATSWNRKAADQFYLHCLNCACQWLENSEKTASVYWALTGKGPRNQGYWQNNIILEQPDGGLGERMAHISNLLVQQHDYWCLVGTDIPHMPSLQSLSLINRLDKADFVFGPALDGGFWLVAGREMLPESIWTSTAYSRSDTLQQMISLLKEYDARFKIDQSLPLLRDIDTFDDLRPLLQSLTAHHSSLSHAQRNLKQWLTVELALEL